MVQKTHGLPPMKISTPPSPSLAHAPRVQQGSQMQHLQVGQLLRASVVDVLSPQLARLAIGQEQVMARTGGGLVAGQQLDLKVAQLKPEVQLQLLQPKNTESARVSLLRAALPQQQPLGSVLSQLAGLARHQHRRLAGDSDLVLAVMIRQWCGHRQTLFRQVAQQHQIGGECIVVQGFEDRQHQWRRLLVAILGLN